jgi:hypothetical protein
MAYMGGLAMLSIAAASFFEPSAAVVAAVKPAPRPDWIEVERPYPAFEMLMPDLAGVDSSYAILRRPADGARKDVLTYGSAAGSGPFLMAEIYRSGAESERFIDAPSEIAARIISYKVIDDVKPAGTLDSKFGEMPLVDFAIAAGRKPDAKARRCLGFAKSFDEPVIQIAGWYCSAGEQAVEQATLACMLDRLTMLSAGGDAKFGRLFANAEIKRTFCGQRNPILAATPERDRPVPIPRSIKLTREPARGRTGR